MNFNEAYQEMRKGKKIRRRSWEMYQYIFKDEDGCIIEENRERFELDIDTLDAINWEIYEEKTEQKEDLPVDNLSFGQVLEYLKKAKLLSRAAWHNPNIYIWLKEAGGSQLPEIRVKTNSNYCAPWMPNHTELLADDWYILEFNN